MTTLDDLWNALASRAEAEGVTISRRDHIIFCAGASSALKVLSQGPISPEGLNANWKLLRCELGNELEEFVK